MDPWEGFNWAASAGFIACLVPQMARTLRLRHAHDISTLFLVLVLLSSLSMLAYTAHARNAAFAAAQVVNLLVWGTVLRYKLRPGRAAPA